MTQPAVATLVPSGACYLRLTNGWTASISASDTPPAMCSVAAWPTTLDDARLTDEQWFQFDDGRIDCRCWCLDDVRAALNRIATSQPPSAGKAA